MAELKLNCKMRRNVTGYLFVLPALAIFGLFKIWPMICGGYIILHSWDGFADMTFVGLEKYRQMLTEDTIFPKVIRNTLPMQSA